MAPLYPLITKWAQTRPVPNFTNPETRTWAAPVAIISLFIVTLVVFCARIRARFRITRTSGIDDWFAIASMPVLLGLVITTVLALRTYGYQLHAYDQTPATTITVFQATLAMEILYLVTTTLTKISILTFYRRMASSLISRPFMIAVRTSIAFVAAYGIVFILALLFNCWPVEAFWFRKTTAWLFQHKYRCNDEYTMFSIISCISTFQDLVACLLPLVVVYEVRLPLKQKLALATIFGIGLATCVTGALRIYFSFHALHLMKSGGPWDSTWDALGIWVCTAVEANLAVICASAPALKAYSIYLKPEAREPRSFGWYNKIITLVTRGG